MKILVLSKYGYKGASSRYRIFQYIPFLKISGINNDINCLFNDEYLDQLYYKSSRSIKSLIKSVFKRLIVLFNIKKYDLIFIEYEIFPYFPAVFEFIFKIFNVKYIVDYDDAIFHNYDLNTNKIIRLVLKNKIKHVIKFASGVIVGSHYLFEYVQKWNKNVFFIPTSVNLEIYNTVIPKKDQIDFVVGWIGSPSTSKYLLPLVDIFKRLNDEGIKFSFIGFDNNLKKKFASIPIKWIDWSEETEIDFIKTFSIGIMPLEDSPWARGKCGFKLIQYMACGIPVLASPVGENNYIVHSGINGFLVNTIEEWYDYIKILSEKKHFLKQLGNNGLKLVENKYSLKVTSKQFINAIISCL